MDNINSFSNDPPTTTPASPQSSPTRSGGIPLSPQDEKVTKKAQRAINSTASSHQPKSTQAPGEFRRDSIVGLARNMARLIPKGLITANEKSIIVKGWNLYADKNIFKLTKEDDSGYSIYINENSKECGEIFKNGPLLTPRKKLETSEELVEVSKILYTIFSDLPREQS